MIKVTAIRCHVCGDVIYSRARHDYRTCSCGACFVDGGLDYMRCGYPDNGPIPVQVTLEIDVTPQQLYEDWNRYANKFGLIKEG